MPFPRLSDDELEQFLVAEACTERYLAEREAARPEEGPVDPSPHDIAGQRHEQLMRQARQE